MPLSTPLRFEPIFRRAIWGGRRLAAQLSKPLPPGDNFAESWEIVDHQDDQSVVLDGSLAGATLRELLRDHPDALLGNTPRVDRFPLLFKFLDAQRDLSVQVHPNDQQAAQLNPPDLGKTEAWVVLDAEPGSQLYVGLRPEIDRATLQRHVELGSAERCLHTCKPQPGDCFFLPAGTVHAIGGGLLIAEIQQASDTTFRLFDWNRLGPDGQPRPLHVDQALEVIDYGRGPIDRQTPEPTKDPSVERLVCCEQFVLNRWRIEQPTPCGGDGRFHLLAVIQGKVSIAGDPADRPLLQGETVLLPASLGPTPITPAVPSVLLQMHLP